MTRRMAAGGGDKKSGVESLPHPIANTGQARNKAAERVGVSGKSAWKEHEAGLAKERQKLSQGRGKKGKESLPYLNGDTGQSRDKAAARVGVNGTRNTPAGCRATAETSNKLERVTRGPGGLSGDVIEHGWQAGTMEQGGTRA